MLTSSCNSSTRSEAAANRGSETLAVRSGGELIGQIFRIFVRRFPALLLVHLPIWVPATLLYLIVFELTRSMGLIPSVLLRSATIALLAPIGAAASIPKLAEAFTGRKSGYEECLRIALRRIGALLGISATVGGLTAALMFGLGYLWIFVLPSPFRWVGFNVGVILILPHAIRCAVGTPMFVAVQACILERRSFPSALARSVQLTWRGWRRIFGIQVIIYLAGMGFLWGVGLMRGLIDIEDPNLDLVIWSAIHVLAQLVEAMLVASAGVCVYFDQRVRKEALDLAELESVVDEIGTRRAG